MFETFSSTLDILKNLKRILQQPEENKTEGHWKSELLMCLGQAYYARYSMNSRTREMVEQTPREFVISSALQFVHLEEMSGLRTNGD